MSSYTALIAGGTGLVGRQLVELIQQSPGYTNVAVAVRKPGQFSGTTCREVVVDYGDWTSFPLTGVDHVFCCLGTTIKKAGSQAAFEAVDYGYVVGLAEAGKKAGVRHFIVISAVGSDPSSRVFYSKVKGKMEERLKQIGFDQLTILRPAMLGGKRDEFRFGEWIASILLKVFGWLLIGKMRRYRIVLDREVAAAMLVASQTNTAAVSVIESEEIPRLAQSLHTPA
jgi:uncharacterized protein YbjT (DUF2867 family)